MSLKIGKRFIILHSLEAGDSVEKTYVGDRIPILLGPGRAFGSGEHETTSSCLEELENLPVSASTKVLDLGSGTGILAIAAAKMGALSVTALDTSPDAIETTISNGKLNGVEKVVIPIQGGLELVKGERFDIILANLYGEVLLSLVSDLAKCLQPGGFLMLSGIHYDFNYELRTAFIKTGLDLMRDRFLENYTTMVFRKESSPLNWLLI
jgi:ribosomal protein L11 methyltransferase